MISWRFRFAFVSMCAALPLAKAGDLSTSFGGRLQLDYAVYQDDQVERDSGGEVRRARLYAKGGLGEGWDYKVQLEFSGDDPELRDGYLRYRGWGPGTLWLGNYKQPSSLEVLTSSKNTVFMERGLITGAAEGRRMGVGYHHAGDRYTVMGSAYGDEANGNAKGTGVIARATYLPYLDDTGVFHLGISAGASNPDDDQLRIRIRPDSHVTDERILDTGTIDDVDRVTRYGLESALVRGRFSAQAEYIAGLVDRAGQGDLSFDGWYAFASWFLTDDSRNYKPDAGYFDKVVPAGRGGAWELAARFATVDLSDREIQGGEGDAITLGLNWYANTHLRFSANYSWLGTDATAGDDDPEVFQVRMQIVF